MWGRKNKNKSFPMTLTRLEVLVRHNTNARTEAIEEILVLKRQVKELQEDLSAVAIEVVTAKRDLKALSDRAPIIRFIPGTPPTMDVRKDD